MSFKFKPKPTVDREATEDELQKIRIDGFKMFVDDVKNGQYPEDKHLIKMEEKELDNFLNKIK